MSDECITKHRIIVSNSGMGLVEEQNELFFIGAFQQDILDQVLHNLIFVCLTDIGMGQR